MPGTRELLRILDELETIDVRGTREDKRQVPPGTRETENKRVSGNQRGAEKKRGARNRQKVRNKKGEAPGKREVFGTNVMPETREAPG